MKKRLAYTVIGFFRDNNQPFTCPVQACNSRDAMGEAVKALLDVNGWDRDYANIIAIVAILAEPVFVASLLPEVVNGAEVIEVDVLAETVPAPAV